MQILYIYETPEILRSIFSTDSCLQSDNGVSTSNTAFMKTSKQAEQGNTKKPPAKSTTKI